MGNPSTPRAQRSRHSVLRGNSHPIFSRGITPLTSRKTSEKFLLFDLDLDLSLLNSPCLTQLLNRNSQFYRLPIELLNRIFEEIEDPRLSVCVGVACRRLYSIRRSVYPNPVRLRVGSYTDIKCNEQFFEPWKLLGVFMSGNAEVWKAGGGYVWDERLCRFRRRMLRRLFVLGTSGCFYQGVLKIGWY
jgi:hypothetical protein